MWRNSVSLATRRQSLKVFTSFSCVLHFWIFSDLYSFYVLPRMFCEAILKTWQYFFNAESSFHFSHELYPSSLLPPALYTTNFIHDSIHAYRYNYTYKLILNENASIEFSHFIYTSKRTSLWRQQKSVEKARPNRTTTTEKGDIEKKLLSLVRNPFLDSNRLKYRRLLN